MFYNQPRYLVYSKLASLLTKAASNEGYEEEFKLIVDFYKENLNPEQLNLQLSIMSCNLPSNSIPHNLASILQYLRVLSGSQRVLMSEAVHLLHLYW